jgi:hypothetical protein
MYRMTHVNSGWVGGLCETPLRLLSMAEGCLTHSKISSRILWTLKQLENQTKNRMLLFVPFLPPMSSRFKRVWSGLLSLSQKLYNSSTHFLGWKLDKGPRVLPSSKSYDLQLRSPGYETLCEPQASCLNISSVGFLFQATLPFHRFTHRLSLNLISSLTVSLTLLIAQRESCLLANLSAIKENKLCCVHHRLAWLGLKSSNQNRIREVLDPFCCDSPQLYPWIPLFQRVLGNRLSRSAIRELELLIRQDPIRVMMTGYGFPIFSPHVSCLIKHSPQSTSHASQPIHWFSSLTCHLLEL